VSPLFNMEASGPSGPFFFQRGLRPRPVGSQGLARGPQALTK
jgi:hypothetical protein